MRVIVLCAVAAGLVWTVPFVFLGGRYTDNVADLTGGSTETPSTRSPQAPNDPGGRANDVRAQTTLNGAMTVARLYHAESGSYIGFDAQVAAGYDPSVAYTSGAPAPGVVSVRGVTPTTVVFVTATTSGAYLCAAANGDAVTYGRVDALAATQCSGGW